MRARTFLCRESLWETFEVMARDQRAPIDEVLSEAMTAYAQFRSQSKVNAAAAAPAQGADAPRSMRRPAAVAAPAPAPVPLPATPASNRAALPVPSIPPPRSGASLPPPPVSSHAIVQKQQHTQPLMAPMRVPAPPSSPSPGPSNRLAHGPGAPGQGSPPPSRGAPPPRALGSGPNVNGTSLSLTFGSQSYPVNKDRFMLGRSKSQADLVLNDSNVSRQHAAIERVGDAWMLVDLGSTNGCFIDGQRVTRRAISDGDVIEITTHKIRCTLR
jgi:hypothetical protein